MTLQLERDSTSPVQSHIDELIARLTIFILATLVLTIAWMMVIDEALVWTLELIQPCSGDCLNLYEPAKWSATRWLSAVILAAICSGPILLMQIAAFARPALLASERRALRNSTWTLYFFLLFCSTFTLGVLIPWLYQNGHQHQEAMGFTARYDAVTMMHIGISIIWAQLLIALGLFATISLGVLGVLNRETADWWRLRIHGFGILMLYVGLPTENPTLKLFLVGLSVVMIEILAKRYWTAPRPIFQDNSSILDSEGRRRDLLLVDCSCDGVLAPLKQDLLPAVRVNSLCHSLYEREKLYETILQNRISDLVVTGCDTAPIPASFKDNCQRIECNLRGLNTLELESFRSSPSLVEGLDVNLAIHAMCDPWSEAQVTKRLVDFLSEQEVLPGQILIDSGTSDQWGLQLSPEQAFLRLSEGIDISKLAINDVEIIQLN